MAEQPADLKTMMACIDAGRPPNVSVNAWRAFAEYPPQTEVEAAALRKMIADGLFAPEPRHEG